MTDLNDLTIASARDGLKAGDFTAVELAEKHIHTMESFRSLNAFITETPDVALQRAKESDPLLYRTGLSLR